MGLLFFIGFTQTNINDLFNKTQTRMLGCQSFRGAVYFTCKYTSAMYNLYKTMYNIKVPNKLE